jgi:membrane protease YdiL (CAAX protease family)
MVLSVYSVDVLSSPWLWMMRGTVEVSVRGRVPAGVATVVVVVVLMLVNVAEHLLPGGLWLGPVVAVALVCFARWSGLSWSQLGLGGDQLWSGSRWALGAIAVVAAAYLAGVLFPLSRSAFLDARYHLAVSGALLSAFVIIPVGTILVEEVAFRSVLWGMLARQLTRWRVLATSSVLFGLWHILPSLHLALTNQGVGAAVRGVGGSATVLVVVATVVVTAIGGAVAGELRHRSGSVLASVGMHWATNALGVLFGLLAWHLSG